MYLAYSDCQASCESGGRVPVTRFHSVMLSPDSVRRVKPPTTTILKTRPAMMKRWVETAGEVRVGSLSSDVELEDEDLIGRAEVFQAKSGEVVVD